MEKIRIQKLLADAGYCSRRQAEALISSGKIKVSGHPVKLGDKALPTDLITVGGERVYIPRKKQYRYLMRTSWIAAALWIFWKMWKSGYIR